MLLKLLVAVVGVLLALFLVVGVAPVLAVWGINWFADLTGMQDELNALDTFERFGQFGDSFGVVTSVATVSALALLFWTFHFQKKEFSDTRKFMRQQTTWNIVLQLCEQYRGMVAHIVITFDGNTDKKKEFRGTDGLHELISEAIGRGDALVGVSHSLRALDVISQAEKAFNPYEGCFRLLHRIFMFIDREIPENEQQKHARIPRAMLSNIELDALLINCLTERGKGMKDFVHKYAILNNYANLNQFVPDKTAYELCMEYDASAFGKDNLFRKKAEEWKKSEDEEAASSQQKH